MNYGIRSVGEELRAIADWLASPSDEVCGRPWSANVTTPYSKAVSNSRVSTPSAGRCGPCLAHGRNVAGGVRIRASST